MLPLGLQTIVSMIRCLRHAQVSKKWGLAKRPWLWCRNPIYLSDVRGALSLPMIHLPFHPPITKHAQLPQERQQLKSTRTIGLQPLEVQRPSSSVSPTAQAPLPPPPRSSWQEGEANPTVPPPTHVLPAVHHPPDIICGSADQSMAVYEEKGPKPTSFVQKVALGVAHGGALLSVILVTRWAVGTGEGFLGGLDWDDQVSTPTVERGAQRWEGKDGVIDGMLSW